MTNQQPNKKHWHSCCGEPANFTWCGDTRHFGLASTGGSRWPHWWPWGWMTHQEVNNRTQQTTTTTTAVMIKKKKTDAPEQLLVWDTHTLKPAKDTLPSIAKKLTPDTQKKSNNTKKIIKDFCQISQNIHHLFVDTKQPTDWSVTTGQQLTTALGHTPARTHTPVIQVVVI